MRFNRNAAMLLGVAMAWAAAPARAQDATTPAQPPRTVVVPPLQTGPTPAGPRRNNSAAPVPSARVLGVPVTADAPVSPSYDGTAYKTLGGQAETGEDAISGQVMQPTGAGPH